MKTQMRKASLIAATAMLSAFGAPAHADDAAGLVSIQLPAETAQLKPGPHLETAQRYCIACHSVDYIYMQPPLTEPQWRALVGKMKKAMGAPIEDADIDALVQYLMSQRGAK
jgi:mono/diheme cytochrome c family protein